MVLFSTRQSSYILLPKHLLYVDYCKFYMSLYIICDDVAAFRLLLSYANVSEFAILCPFNTFLLNWEIVYAHINSFFSNWMNATKNLCTFLLKCIFTFLSLQLRTKFATYDLIFISIYDLSIPLKGICLTFSVYRVKTE